MEMDETVAKLVELHTVGMAGDDGEADESYNAFMKLLTCLRRSRAASTL